MSATEENIFTSPSGKSDLVLLVEEKKLYVNRAVLSYASPVFERMFEGNFKEKSLQEIPLPGKKYEAMIQLLLCVFPSATDHPITREKMDCVLPLADEYSMEFIKQRCDKFILNRFQLKETKFQNPDNKELVHFLYLSDKYGLTSALDECIEKAAQRDFEGDRGLKIIEEFPLVSYESKFTVLCKRLALLEMPAKAIHNMRSKSKITDIFNKAIRPECQGFWANIHSATFCFNCRKNSKSHFETLSTAVDKLSPCFKV